MRRLFGDDGIEPIERFHPMASLQRTPGFDFAQGFRADPDEAPLPMHAPFNQPGPFQNLQMPRNSGGDIAAGAAISATVLSPSLTSRSTMLRLTDQPEPPGSRSGPSCHVYSLNYYVN
ncbi:MAG: hypothetical protein ACLPID_20735 [Beijerinckiaceae bacterium]